VVDLRLGASIAAGRLSGALIRTLGLGGATTVPGRVARVLVPDLLARLGRGLARGSVLVSGTNGKTTTARLLAWICRRAGWTCIHNRAGANLPAGIAAALVAHSALDGRVRGDMGVFEVDEAALPLVSGALRPRILVLGNLFRDQLDRYGEIDLVADRWRAALRDLPADAAVIYNADDPLVADVVRTRAGARTFGIADPSLRRGERLEHAADGRYCYRCGVPYAYRAAYLGHLGEYHCPSCGTARPPLDVGAVEVRLHGMAGSTFVLAAGGQRVALTTVLPGLYNVYNVVAAAAAVLALGIPLPTVAAAVREFTPAFGRGESMTIAGHPAYMLLAKNPAGFNEVLRTVLADGRPIVAVIAINDLTADGRDVSWLWDVDFEMLSDRCRLAVVTGMRAHDMAVRLKYAGLPQAAVVVEPDEGRALRRGVEALRAGEPLYVLPTYTAMLRLRHILARRGLVHTSWED
jgi:UDP-N-acetylmuramyl tripeptide synthase